MEELAQEQKKLGEMINHLLENMRKDSSSRKTIPYINDRRQRFHSYWAEFEKHHQKIAALGDQEHKYFKNNFYEQVETAFNEGLRLLDIYFERAQGTVGEAPTKTGKSIITTDSTKLDDIPPKGTSELIKPRSHEDTSKKSVSARSNENEMGELDMRIRKQRVKMRSLKRLMEDVIQNIDHVHSKTYYGYEKKTLMDNVMSISTLHEEISILAEDFEDPYFLQEEYEQLEGKYEEVMLLLHEKEGSQDDNNPQPDLKSRLPRQSIPIFEGGYTAWTSFLVIFVQIIRKNPQLCYAEKMQYLKTHLKGEAARLIAHLGISDTNYLTSWNLVSERYDNKRILLFHQLELLCSLPNLNIESVKGLKQMHDTTRECLHAIKNLGNDNITWGPIIVFNLMKKLDRETKRV